MTQARDFSMGNDPLVFGKLENGPFQNVRNDDVPFLRIKNPFITRSTICHVWLPEGSQGEEWSQYWWIIVIQARIMVLSSVIFQRELASFLSRACVSDFSYVSPDGSSSNTKHGRWVNVCQKKVSNQVPNVIRLDHIYVGQTASADLETGATLRRCLHEDHLIPTIRFPDAGLLVNPHKSTRIRWKWKTWISNE